MTHWLHAGASVVGQGHLTTGTPCQDKCHIRVSEDGAWLAVAVCDGAGSAEFADVGAAITSQYFCQELVKLAQELETRLPGEWINDFVIDRVLRVRDRLREHAKSDDIRKYHCTLVAALVGPHGGFSVHIGDGAIVGGTFAPPGSFPIVELGSNVLISKPENGEYANETFFVTEGAWVKHLRISPLPRIDWLVVCTDGGASLLLDNDSHVKPAFLTPFLEDQISDGFTDGYVEGVLADPKANKLTTDDKTIAVAVRSKSLPKSGARSGAWTDAAERATPAPVPSAKSPDPVPPAPLPPTRPSDRQDRQGVDVEIHLVPSSTARRKRFLSRRVFLRALAIVGSLLVLAALLWLLNRCCRNQLSAWWGAALLRLQEWKEARKKRE